MRYLRVMGDRGHSPRGSIHVDTETKVSNLFRHTISMLLTNQISCIRHVTWLWRVLIQFLASFSWIEDVMVSRLWVGDVPPELAEVSVGKLASLDDESFWKLAVSQYDDHEFDSFDVDDGFWREASQQTTNIMDDSEEKSTSKGSSSFAKPETVENLQRIVDGAKPPKTRNQTDWAVRTWMSWRLARIQAAQPNDETPPRLTQMSKSKLCKWLSFFEVEVRRQDSKRYPGAMLHGILCGIQRSGVQVSEGCS